MGDDLDDEGMEQVKEREEGGGAGKPAGCLDLVVENGSAHKWGRVAWTGLDGRTLEKEKGEEGVGGWGGGGGGSCRAEASRIPSSQQPVHLSQVTQHWSTQLRLPGWREASRRSTAAFTSPNVATSAWMLACLSTKPMLASWSSWEANLSSGA